MVFNFNERVGKAFASNKTVGRSREKSAFNKAICDLDLKVGQYIYISHKAWLDSLVASGKKLEDMKAGSLNNGPRYSLKALGLKAQAVNLSGSDLDKVAKAENNELTESSVIYEITKLEVIK